jgi:putative chitinase
MKINTQHDKLLQIFKGGFSTKQINGIMVIIDEAGDIDPRHLAYILATIYHETGRAMNSVEEASYLSREVQQAYLKSKKYYPHHGRDLVHTTWLENYERVKKEFGVDVVTHPELISEMPLAAKIAIKGMQEGWFTRKKLSDYFNDKIEDPINARRIINGLDKAKLIADYYYIFLDALT